MQDVRIFAVKECYTITNPDEFFEEMPEAVAVEIKLQTELALHLERASLNGGILVSTYWARSEEDVSAMKRGIECLNAVIRKHRSGVVNL